MVGKDGKLNGIICDEYGVPKKDLAKEDKNFQSKSKREIEEFMNIHKDTPMYDLQDYNSCLKVNNSHVPSNNFTMKYKKEAPFMTSSQRFEG